MKYKKPISSSLILITLIMPIVASPRQTGIDEKIDFLLKQMTLEEKLGQLQQLDGEAN